MLMLLAVVSTNCWAGGDGCSGSGRITNDSGWCVPQIKLQGRLAEIFTLAAKHCQAISGLTCRIKYNGRLPLPGAVFFVELDKSGRPLGRPIRLIYPHLNQGETGYATFATEHEAATLLLIGKWDGPWRAPY